MSAPRSAAQRRCSTRWLARVPPAVRGRGRRSAASLPTESLLLRFMVSGFGFDLVNICWRRRIDFTGLNVARTFRNMISAEPEVRPGRRAAQSLVLDHGRVFQQILFLAFVLETFVSAQPDAIAVALYFATSGARAA